ncbi:hypothetical protein [Amycolatopsis taiwanensis]
MSVKMIAGTARSMGITVE